MSIQFFSKEDTRFSVILEDDDKVCYLYLLQNEDIVGDVWLYNKAMLPKEVDWKTQELPFLNPGEFTLKNDKLFPIEDFAEISVDWQFQNENLDYASVFLSGINIAILKLGSKPGWSIGAAKDGPLAKVLKEIA